MLNKFGETTQAEAQIISMLYCFLFFANAFDSVMKSVNTRPLGCVKSTPKILKANYVVPPRSMSVQNTIITPAFSLLIKRLDVGPRVVHIDVCSETRISINIAKRLLYTVQTSDIKVIVYRARQFTLDHKDK